MKNLTLLKIASLFIFFTTAVFASCPTTNNPLSSRDTEIYTSALGICEDSDNIILNNNTPSENSVSSITVNSGENVTISGNHTLGFNESITVASGGTLTITGSLTATSSEITVSIDGTLNVGGNYVTASSGHSHTFNGNVYVGGNFQNASSSTVNVYGSLEITGQLKLTNGGKLEGFSGHITYSSVDVNNCGGSYLKCNTTGFGQNINCNLYFDQNLLYYISNKNHHNYSHQQMSRLCVQKNPLIYHHLLVLIVLLFQVIHKR